MRIVSWNVNGIRAVHKKGFMDYLSGDSPDILCLQEVRADESQIEEDKRQPLGYYASYYPHQLKKGYSGVAIYSKEKPLSVTSGFGVEKFDVEGRVLQADFGDFIIMSVYFPKGYSEKEADGDAAKLARLHYKMDFYDAIFNYAKSLRAQGRKLIISGDYNTAHREIDLARPKQNRETSGFLDLEREKFDEIIMTGYVDTFREYQPEGGHYSWWSQRAGAREKNIGWRIDYHLISDDLKPRLKHAEILPHVLGSDHCPVVVELT